MPPDKMSAHPLEELRRVIAEYERVELLVRDKKTTPNALDGASKSLGRAVIRSAPEIYAYTTGLERALRTILKETDDPSCATVATVARIRDMVREALEGVLESLE